MDDARKDESTYDADRFDRAAWRVCRQMGLSRREFIEKIAVGAGALAILGTARAARSEGAAVVKPTPPELFIDHGTNREMRFEAMAGRGYLTPNELFFIRNHTATPAIDASAWRLKIFGSGVAKEIELAYDDLLELPSTTVTKFIECAGNGRSQFLAAHGKKASGTPWRLGAIGVAEWRGVRLSDVLDRAGLKKSALDVMPQGLDAQALRRPMSIEKALDSETLVVTHMNGKPLPPDHGFPARLLVPGWVGVANVKWVGSIEVSATPLQSPWNTTSYIMIGDAYPNHPPVHSQKVKSALELPFGGTLTAGARTLTGRAWSAHGRIEKVEVSADGGVTWARAKLGAKNLPQAWVEWDLPWQAAPGNYHLMARATDAKGNVQPETVPYNEQGYLYWAVVKHPIRVTA